MADNIKLSGTYDSIEAYNILTEMQSLETTIEGYKDDAEAAASTAGSAVSTAQGYANAASGYADNAQTYAGNANDSADEAAGYASNASTSATNAANSATNASGSASAAATSATNAAASATAAAASEAVVNGALPLSGGTMTGYLSFNASEGRIQNINNDVSIGIYGGSGYLNGAYFILNGKDKSQNGGAFGLYARDASGVQTLFGKPDGTLTWGGKNVLTDATVGTILEASTSADVSLSASAAKNITSLSVPKGTWIITGHARFDNVTSGKAYGAMFGGTSASYNSNNDSAIYVHSSSTTPISIQTTRIIVQNSQATVYFVGYANAACKVLSGATFRAIRIL